MLTTNVYIDGFNLFYGCLKGGRNKWLNLQHLFEAVLPNNAVQTIRYFTAIVEARDIDPDLPVRQAAYLRALATLPKVEVHLGTFLSSPVRAPVLDCGQDGKPTRRNGKCVVKRRANGAPVMEWIHKTEEKGSDVNLASHLLRDAYRGDIECAVIVSNDSDLLTPIRMVQADTQLPVGLITPRRTGSVELRRLATFKKDIRTHQLAAAQFPDQLSDAAGMITKPADW